MTEIVSIDTLIILRAVLPCLVIIFIGYLVGKADRAEHEKTLSSLIYFVFAPCLVFSGIHRHVFRFSEIGAIAIASILLLLLISVPAFALKKINKISDKGYVLPIIFGSTNTILMPIAYLLYGNEGLAKAALFHLFTAFLFHMLGPRLVIGHIQPARFFRNPSFFAAVIAILSVETNIPLPDAFEGFFWLIERGIDIVGRGAIPVLLLSFGYPFSRLQFSSLRKGFSGGFVRMFAGPLAAFVIILALRQVGLLHLLKGYSILDYIDMRTTEAVIILAGCVPGTFASYLLTSKFKPDSSSDSLAILISSSLIGVVTIPFTLFMINRLILSG